MPLLEPEGTGVETVAEVPPLSTSMAAPDEEELPSIFRNEPRFWGKQDTLAWLGLTRHGRTGAPAMESSMAVPVLSSSISSKPGILPNKVTISGGEKMLPENKSKDEKAI